jgi:hypothetical protein
MINFHPLVSTMTQHFKEIPIPPYTGSSPYYAERDIPMCGQRLAAEDKNWKQIERDA